MNDYVITNRYAARCVRCRTKVGRTCGVMVDDTDGSRRVHCVTCAAGQRQAGDVSDIDACDDVEADQWWA